MEKVKLTIEDLKKLGIADVYGLVDEKALLDYVKEQHSKGFEIEVVRDTGADIIK